MILNICICLISLSNIGLAMCIFCIDKRLDKHADYILKTVELIDKIIGDYYGINNEEADDEG